MVFFVFFFFTLRPQGVIKINNLRGKNVSFPGQLV